MDTAPPVALDALPDTPFATTGRAPRSDQPSVGAGEIDRQGLVVAHMPLVSHIVRETMNRLPDHVDRSELQSAGLIALVTASRSFDPARGIPFAKYAASRVRGAILDELRAVDWASRGVRRRGREIDTARSALATSLRRVPDDAQVAEATGMTVAEVQRCDEDVARAALLSLEGYGDQSLQETLRASDPTPDAALEQREQLEYLHDAIAELPDRLQGVVEGYFLQERPMAELAAELGVTESRISQMRAEALVLLRDALNTALEPQLVPEAERPDGCAARRRDTYFRAVLDRHAARAARSARSRYTALDPALDFSA